MATKQQISFSIFKIQVVFKQLNDNHNINFLFHNFQEHKADQGLNNFLELLRPEHRESITSLNFDVRSDDVYVLNSNGQHASVQNLAFELLQGVKHMSVDHTHSLEIDLICVANIQLISGSS